MAFWLIWVSQGRLTCDAGGRQALVLAIERQVPGELIDQHAGDEADIGPTVIDDALRGRGAHDALVLFELHHAGDDT